MSLAHLALDKGYDLDIVKASSVLEAFLVVEALGFCYESNTADTLGAHLR
jgi:hypothetical protein